MSNIETIKNLIEKECGQNPPDEVAEAKSLLLNALSVFNETIEWVDSSQKPDFMCYVLLDDIESNVHTLRESFDR